ncbi:MAG: MBL fold metallo-hydrolase [Vicinamibacteraceae bacterium]
MKPSRRSFLKSSAGVGIGLAVSLSDLARAAAPTNATRIQLIRHATCIIRYGGRVLMVDPMLGAPGIMPPIDNSPQPRRNPLVPLPAAADNVLAEIEAILVTHTHPDHWDTAAIELVPKDATVFIQPPDAAAFRQRGFTGAQAVGDSISWNGLTISRTSAQHGRGDVGRRMAPVSGYVLSSPGQPTIYVAGDTVWCPEVADAIETHEPDIIVVNAGAAQFLEGGPITMDTSDVLEVCAAAPKADVIAVHMEAINHCILTRRALRDALDKSRAKPRVRIPRDGEELQLT